jgi:hypothetical protein
VIIDIKLKKVMHMVLIKAFFASLEGRGGNDFEKNKETSGRNKFGREGV